MERSEGLTAVLLRHALAISSAVLLCTLSCQEDPYAERKVVQLEGGKSLEVLREEVDGEYYILEYVSVVSHKDPLGVKRDAQSVLELYAGPQAEQNSCTKVLLEAIELLDSEYWRARAIEFSAYRNRDGSWEIED